VYDPSLLDQLERVGYDCTFDDLPAVQFSPIIPGEPGGGWRGIRVNPLSGYVTLPVGIKLDFSTIFLAVHVLAVWVDPFTHFGWSEVFIPFVSNYRPVWMALGIVGMYLGVAIGISTWLRPLIGYTWWRRLHVLTLGIYALATLHAIGTGSDTHTWWGHSSVGGCLPLTSASTLRYSLPLARPMRLIQGALSLSGVYEFVAGNQPGFRLQRLPLVQRLGSQRQQLSEERQYLTPQHYGCCATNCPICSYSCSLNLNSAAAIVSSTWLG